MGCIYLAKSITTGKVYIGKTIRSMEDRRAQHLATARAGKGYRFHRAIRKYGEADFEWTILAESKRNSELFSMEERFIAEYASTKRAFGYNVTPGGSQWDGTVYGNEAMRKLCRDYAEVCGLNEWALRKLRACPPGKEPTVSGNKLSKLAIPLFVKVLPLVVRSTEAMKDKLGRAFELIDDDYAKYEITGYWESVRKVGA